MAGFKPSAPKPESEAVTNGLPPELSYKGETIVFVSRDSDFVRDEVSVEENDGDNAARELADFQLVFGIKGRLRPLNWLQAF